MIQNVGEGLARYKTTVAEFKRWLEGVTLNYHTVFKQNQLSLFHAEGVMADYSKDAETFRMEVLKLKTMMGVLNLTDDEIAEIHEGLNLTLTIYLPGVSLHSFLLTPPFDRSPANMERFEKAVKDSLAYQELIFPAQVIRLL